MTFCEHQSALRKNASPQVQQPAAPDISAHRNAWCHQPGKQATYCPCRAKTLSIQIGFTEGIEYSPLLGVPPMVIVDGVEHVVLNVPAEAAEHHAHIQPWHYHACNILVNVAQHGAIGPSQPGEVVQVPGVTCVGTVAGLLQRGPIRSKCCSVPQQLAMLQWQRDDAANTWKLFRKREKKSSQCSMEQEMS